MSVTKRLMQASPSEIYSALSDPNTYADWVVGASEIRGVDGPWPEVGATFHHTQGLPWIGAKDTTTVLEADPDRHIRLCVRVRPYVVAEVDLTLRPVDGKTEVTMHEKPVGGYIARVNNPLFELGFHLRNVESLRRLEKVSRKVPAA